MPHFKPERYHTVTPHLTAKDANELIAFLEKAFGVSEKSICATAPDGAIMHAELTIGDSLVMVGQANESCGGTTTAHLYIYVKDTDKTYHQALKAGGVSVRKPEDMFYGDRNAAVKDPSGNTWWIATHVEDVSHEEMEKRAKAAHKKPVGAAK